jgi:hypothetical protein
MIGIVAIVPADAPPRQPDLRACTPWAGLRARRYGLLTVTLWML